MNILKDTALECNPYLKINFDGGDLSSDAGLLLIKEFAEKIGLVKLIYRLFKTLMDLITCASVIDSIPQLSGPLVFPLQNHTVSCTSH